tara:strand:- start:113 stop:799 length:687 start_codon:yes stop_codon:yes gene_type:complete
MTAYKSMLAAAVGIALFASQPSFAGTLTYRYDPGPVTYYSEKEYFGYTESYRKTEYVGFGANSKSSFYFKPYISFDTDFLPFDLRGVTLQSNDYAYSSKAFEVKRDGVVIYDEYSPGEDWLVDLGRSHYMTSYFLEFDELGNITDWNVWMLQEHIYSQFSPKLSGEYTEDIWRETGNIFYETETRTPGTWTRTGELPPAPVPLPAAGLMLLLGLFGMGAARNRGRSVI